MNLLIRNVLFACFLLPSMLSGQQIPKQFIDPPREFSLMPFWFWNDTLKTDEILRQIKEFDEHGVYGFVIHPRMGLPSDMKFLSSEMLSFMKVAIEEAARRNMKVILYDEGSYPSGSCEGQVVERNPEHAARGLAKIDLELNEEPQLEEGWKLVTIINRPNGKRMAVIECPSNGHIRGLHWLDEEKGKEDTPPAGDILNPEAVSSFIELVYDKFATNFGLYFGKTVIAVFTDEPNPLGRGNKKGMVPGNVNLVPQISKILGYDFTPFFADLWYEETPEWKQHRTDYHRAVAVCLEENYYGRLGKWCQDHDIALTGHPAGSMDLGAQKYFQIPGQDLVWRYVEPGEKALNGEHSTMAKNASSAMVHLNRRRNSNELYGAYGHNLTYDEMVWLANWCFVRGQNLLYPHAFYYSVRGARYDERPPDVGPNAQWWGNYKPYADACRRLSWLNTDSRQVCDIAILGEANWLPDKSAKVCFQNQFDFNYLELSLLETDATTDSEGVHIGGMNYKLVILDGLSHLPENVLPALRKLEENGRLVIYKNSPFASEFPKAILAKEPVELLAVLQKKLNSDLNLNPSSENIRYRHVIKDGAHYYILFNEEETSVKTKIKIPFMGNHFWLDEFTGEAIVARLKEPVSFDPHELKILLVEE
ncbi:MAG: glycosyl hydrolase [Draconibacterium sp.]